MRMHQIKKTIVTVLTVAVMITVSSFAVPQPSFAATPSLKGKTVLIEGDSIQAGFGTFLATACKSLNAKKVVNKAVNGSTLALRELSEVSVYSRMMAMPDSTIAKYQYIFIAAGTNDFGNYKCHGRRDLGEIDSKDPETTCGALRAIIERIQAASPKTKIIISPPIRRFHGWTEENFTTREFVDCDKLVNDYGYTLKDYRDRMKQVAAEYRNVYALDERYLTSKAEMKNKLYTGDYCHPRTLFAKVIIAKRAKKQILTIIPQKIVKLPAVAPEG